MPWSLATRGYSSVRWAAVERWCLQAMCISSHGELHRPVRRESRLARRSHFGASEGEGQGGELLLRAREMPAADRSFPSGHISRPCYGAVCRHMMGISSTPLAGWAACRSRHGKCTGGLRQGEPGQVLGAGKPRAESAERHAGRVWHGAGTLESVKSGARQGTSASVRMGGCVCFCLCDRKVRPWLR